MRQLLARHDDEVMAFGDVVRIMYGNSAHWKCAFIFTWGIASGVLSVGITILKQAGVISS